MDRYNQCSDEQRNDARRGNPCRSIPELLDDLADAMSKLPPERVRRLMEELEFGELEGEGVDDDAKES